MKYLFTAQFNDGTEYKQTQEDTSIKQDDKSAFFDIKDRQDIQAFRLDGDGHSYSVNLTTGHFEIDGVPFGVNEPVETSEPLRLIYFRRNIIDHAGVEILNHDVTYYIGWQTTIDGKNHKQIIQIA